MNEPITTKGRMYRLLAAGLLGNTVPQWFSPEAWEADPESARYSVWAVRTLTPGGPCRLYCRPPDVRPTVESLRRQGHAVNISVMLDAIVAVTLMADVYDSPDRGLLVYGVENPGRGTNWREVMPSLGRQFEGVTAHALLRRHLNPSSLADLEALRDAYPGHVYELSACERCVGTVPWRNAVVWEVRAY